MCFSTFKPNPKIVRFVYLPKTESTQRAILEDIAQNKTLPIALLAQQQTKGRGCYGHTWESHHTGNIYLSVAYPLQCALSELGLLSLSVALFICKALKTQFNLSIQTKWPNDLIVDNKKLGGILLETTVIEKQKILVFGIGLNVNAPDKNAMTSSTDSFPTIYLSQIKASRLSLEKITYLLIDQVVEVYQATLNKLLKQQVSVLWNQFGAFIGNKVQFLKDGSSFEGILQGIDRNGNLCLKLSSTETCCFKAGTIQFKNLYASNE